MSASPAVMSVLSTNAVILQYRSQKSNDNINENNNQNNNNNNNNNSDHNTSPSPPPPVGISQLSEARILSEVELNSNGIIGSEIDECYSLRECPSPTFSSPKLPPRVSVINSNYNRNNNNSNNNNYTIAVTAANEISIEREDTQQLLTVDWDCVNCEVDQQRVSSISSDHNNNIYNNNNMNNNQINRNIGEREFISFIDAVRELKNDTSAWEPYISPTRFNENRKRNCLISLLLSCCCKEDTCIPLSFNSNSNSRCGMQESSNNPKYTIQRDVEFTLTFPSVPFDHSHEIHRRLLMTIRNSLFIINGNNNNNNSYNGGMDWEKLGFQGTDPATDLRSTGIFGLLQLVYLIEFYKDFVIHLWETCTKGGNSKDIYEELPFVLIGFNFSAVVLDRLRENQQYDDIMRYAHNLHTQKIKLNHFSQSYNGKSSIVPNINNNNNNNNNRNDLSILWEEFPFLLSCCEYHVGCLFLFWEWWLQLKKQKGGKAPTIGDFGVVKAKLCAKIKKNGAQFVFDACARANDFNLMQALAAEAELTDFQTINNNNNNNNNNIDNMQFSSPWSLPKEGRREDMD